MRNALVPLLAAVLLVGTPGHAHAQGTAPDRTGQIDEIFRWATPATPGGVVAVSQNGKVVVHRAYGSADLERDVPIRPDTVFDIGSLRKQFIAAAVLLLAEDGRLSLSDDVRKHVPELPDYGHKITLDHLLTHTSGIRDWTGLLPLAGSTADVLPLILRQKGLNFAPGEEWSYSNSGYVLLKEVVTRASGVPFAEFTRRRLFEPLGMKATAYREDLRDVVKDRALAYEKEGDGWQLDMLLGNDRGGGGALLSTAGDLLLWNDALTSGRLGASVSEKLQEPAKLNNGRRLRYARGLNVEPARGGGTMVWHSGGAAGYHSFLARFPEQGLSVAVLCNSDAVAATALARRVADRFLPTASGPPAAPSEPAAAPDPKSLGGRAGLFFHEGASGEPLRLLADDAGLRIAGGPALVAAGADRFRNPRGDLSFRSQDEFELRFVSADGFELKSMEGRTTRYRRARPYAPAAGDLTAFTGRYESDEIGTVFQMAPTKEGLVMRFELSPDKKVEFRPVERDAFQAGGMTVRFRRDGAGRVVGFDYSNPLVRAIRFTRLRGRG